VNKAVFDSSALLAVINVESGSGRVAELLAEERNRALISAVNLSEAQAVLINRGMPDDEAWELLSEFNLDVVAFDAEQAQSAGALITQTRKFGLSFGDRACLALGMRESCVVVTADQIWKKLKVGVQVELIRG
jgi:PIN domain nuclease of toxin-antitoxin system